MAETAKMNSQLWTSYSTSYTLWGLSRLYLAILTRDLTTGPITNGAGLIFSTKIHDICMVGRGVPKCVNVDVRSIFDVKFLSENFSLYMAMVGLRKFFAI